MANFIETFFDAVTATPQTAKITEWILWALIALVIIIGFVTG